VKHSVLLLFLAGIILLLITTASVTAALSTISTISPAVGYTGKTMTVTITGENFTSTEGDVRLAMSGEDTITATTISSWSDTQIVCKFKITSSRATEDWDLIVIRGVMIWK
jgi:hypothetical protein